MCPKPSYKPPKLPNPFKTPIHEMLYVRNECHTQSRPCKRSIGQYGGAKIRVHPLLHLLQTSTCTYTLLRFIKPPKIS